MSDELLQTTTVLTGLKGDKYTFAIPGLYAEFTIAARVKDIRRQTDPNWNGYAAGLDANTNYGMNAAATWDVQLRKATADWCYSADDGGLPKVDSSKFPDDKVDEVMHVYGEYLDAVARFRATGSPDKQPAGQKTVDGSEDTGGKTLPG